MSLRRSPNALGRWHRCRVRWPENSADTTGGVAPCRAGVSRAGKEGRAGAFPARNDTERGTPVRRGAVTQHPRTASRRRKNEGQQRADKRPQCAFDPRCAQSVRRRSSTENSSCIAIAIAPTAQHQAGNGRAHLHGARQARPTASFGPPAGFSRSPRARQCGTTHLPAGRCARRCGHRKSRAVPATGWPTGARCAGCRSRPATH